MFMIIYIRKSKDRVHGKWKYKSTQINVNVTIGVKQK